MASEKLKSLDSPDFYTIGWIAALSIERAAAEAMLDEEHATPKGFQHPPNDSNSYTWGSIGEHNIVIVSLEEGVYGLASAGATAIRMTSTLPSIRIGLLVGIGGGIPRDDSDYDIRLGDVVVSKPDGTTGGILQYDFVKATLDSRPKRQGFLVPPPHVLLNALSKIRSVHERKGSKVPSILKRMLEENVKMTEQTTKRPGYFHQGFENDRLFLPTYEHCLDKDCSSCEKDQEVQRDERESTDPEVHYGIIASGNTLVKNGVFRDQLVADAGENCLCVEMEAAGLMNHFPCLVIRGICDYADSHKNHRWQRYASATAAAYAKELLEYVPVADVQETKRAADVMSSVERTALATKAAVDSLKSDSDHQRIRKWLAAPDPNSNANHARKLRHEGTGSWLLECEMFQSWVAGAQKHLWLSGMPGCGKTVLSTTVIDYLTKFCSKCVLSFFFDFSDTNKQTKSDLLRSITFQTYHKGLDSRKVDDLFRRHGDGNVEPTTHALEGLVDLVLGASDKMFIVLDALDESTSSAEILAWIRKTSKYDHVQMIYTSRKVADLIDSVPALIGKACCLEMDQSAIDADICSYVKRTIESDDRFASKRLPQYLKDHIENKVGNGAKGMFKWAACQLDTLARCVNPKELERDLNMLPSDICETYERILERIPEGFKSGAMRLLQFVVYAWQPPTLQEAIEIIATDIDKDPPHFYPDCRLFNITEILQHYTSLVSVVEVISFEGVRQEIHLAHFSVKEYLLIDSHFEYVAASIVITKTCLIYLTDIEGHRWNLAQKSPMARYASKTWLGFASAAETSGDVSKRIAQFLQNKETFLRWTYLHYDDEDEFLKIVKFQNGENDEDHLWKWYHDSSLCPSLYYACLGGLTMTARSILDQGADVNARCKTRNAWTPLQAAISSGNLETIELILEKNPELDARDDENTGALLMASERGDLEVVKLLLKKEANVDAHNLSAGNALHAACAGGHIEIVKLLLENDADVHLRDDKHGNALIAAASGGVVGIVQLLLDAKMDINAEGDSYHGTALRAASMDGHLDIVQLLLREGADINAQSMQSSALLSAIQGNHVDVVRFLLANKANTSGRGGQYQTPLQAAAYYGNEEIVKMLLDLQVDVNEVEEGEWGSALHNACGREGHENMVRMLLDRGANVNAKGGYHGSPLQAACFPGKERIVKMLLDRGANVNAKGGYHGSPLQAACFSGSERNVRMLLDHGANVNAQGGEYGNALQAACATPGLHYGNENVVRMLLDCGANINAQGGYHESPLLAACGVRNHSLIKILMEYEADVSALHMVETYTKLLNTACWFDRSINVTKMLADIGVHISVPQDTLDELLQDFSGRGRIEEVEHLLGQGANVNAQGCGEFENALFEACDGPGDNRGVIQLLLESGADINLGGEFGTALHAAAFGGKAILVEMLLDLGADVNASGWRSTTALLDASRNGRGDIVQILLDSGARTETVDDYGETPLCAASMMGHADIVKSFIDRGGDLDDTDPNFGRTALSFAAQAGHQSVVELLLASPRVNPHSKDSIGRSPLLFASIEGRDGIVDLLLRRDAPVNQADRYLSTPLSMAARQGHTNVARCLVAAGATLDSQDSFGRTPVWWARRGAHTEIVQLLVDAGNRLGIGLDDGMASEVPRRRHCDICTFRIQGHSGGYICPFCNGGTFHICTDCYELGGRCLEDSHRLEFLEREETDEKLSLQNKCSKYLPEEGGVYI